jgi:hypothetical protein
VIIQTGESIKREAVYGDVNRGREQRTLVEADTMDVMVIQHGLLNYQHPSIDPLFYMDGTVTEVSLLGTFATTRP